MQRNARKANAKNAEAPDARLLCCLVQPFPDFDFFFVKPLRERVIELLQLKAGARVLDMGCGAGGSFPYLVEAVGATGEVVGVDISGQNCINARRRIARNGWRNLQVFEVAAQQIELSERYDSVLMFAPPDVFCFGGRVGKYISTFARECACGFFSAKFSNGPLGRLLNPVLRMLVAKLSPTTSIPDEAPWKLLQRRINGFHVEVYFLG